LHASVIDTVLLLQVYAQHHQPVLTCLSKVIQVTKGKEDWGHCRDNAATALGKILFHEESLASGELGLNLGKMWLQCLPIAVDETEAGGQHAILKQLVARNDPRVLGENAACLPQIAEVFVRVIGRGSELLRDDDVAEFQHFFFKQLLPELQKKGYSLEQAAQALEPQDQQRFATAAAANGVSA
jgi:hypothetical protein